jgi:hypothetical protein
LPDQLRDPFAGPVEIVHRRDHKLVKGPKGSRGCKHVLADGSLCGKAKSDPVHHGPPPSLNVAGSGANHFAYQEAKKRWQSMLTELLDATDLPRPCASVHVEGLCCFPDRIRRDQGNFRYFIEKALGDALVAGGWLADDDWDHYEFGGLAKTYERGESWIKLMIMPVAADHGLEAAA